MSDTQNTSALDKKILQEQGNAAVPRGGKPRTRTDREKDSMDDTKAGLTAPVPAVDASSPAATFSGLPSFTEPPPAPPPAEGGNTQVSESIWPDKPSNGQDEVAGDYGGEYNPHPPGSPNYERYDNGLREPPHAVEGEIDVSMLVKAQAEFVWANTQFVKRQFSVRDYSYAQSRYIEALSEVLRQVGVF
jgi:hypothetical protein